MDETAGSLEEALSRITAQELSRNEKYGHLVLALVGGIFAWGAGEVLYSWPGLAVRMQLGVMAVAVVGAAWLLTTLAVVWRKHAVMAEREVVLASVSVLFTVLFSLACMLARYLAAGDIEAPWAGLVLTAMAGALWLRAYLRRASLRTLRAKLETELAGAR